MRRRRRVVHRRVPRAAMVGQPAGFRRALTFFDVTNITVGAIVGADIYVASAITAGMLGPASLLAWLAAGGLLYTLGVVFYLKDREWRHAHGIWHLFVMGGSGSHFVAVMYFVA